MLPALHLCFVSNVVSLDCSINFFNFPRFGGSCLIFSVNYRRNDEKLNNKLTPQSVDPTSFHSDLTKTLFKIPTLNSPLLVPSSSSPSLSII